MNFVGFFFSFSIRMPFFPHDVCVLIFDIIAHSSFRTCKSYYMKETQGSDSQIKVYAYLINTRIRVEKTDLQLQNSQYRNIILT